MANHQRGEVMAIRHVGTCAAVFLVVAVSGTSVQALTLQECGTKFRAAQAAGTLGGMKWTDFRKAQCGPGAMAAPASTASPAPATAGTAAGAVATRPAAPMG